MHRSIFSTALKSFYVLKLWNPRGWPRNGCDGRSMAKFIMTIQVKLWSLIPALLGIGTNIPELLLINFFINFFHHSRFLAILLNFTTFSNRPFWTGLHFYTVRCRYHIVFLFDIFIIRHFFCLLQAITELHNNGTSWTVYRVTCL